jgi:hypothetical protein
MVGVDCDCANVGMVGVDCDCAQPWIVANSAMMAITPADNRTDLLVSMTVLLPFQV